MKTLLIQLLKFITTFGFCLVGINLSVHYLVKTMDDYGLTSACPLELHKESLGYEKVVKTYYIANDNFPVITYEPKIGDMGRVYGSSSMGNYSDCIIDDTCPY